MTVIGEYSYVNNLLTYLMRLVYILIDLFATGKPLHRIFNGV